jgi:hypothetical protein
MVVAVTPGDVAAVGRDGEDDDVPVPTTAVLGP